MATVRIAGLIGLASLGAQAQVNNPPTAYPFDPVLVTANRTVSDALPTLRDAVVIGREELDAAGPITFAEALQRYAGVEIRANGGPGQTSSLFLRGAGSAQTLVLIDGLRVGSATTGATAIEAIPLDMIERIEVVKGPLSSLYGSDAIGGVVQVFTRGKAVPHLFAAAGYGTENDRRVSAGISTVDGDTQLSLSAGGRDVDARSATNPRVSFGYDPDRDPHSDVFVNARASQRLWNNEVIALEAFGTRSRTKFDGGSPDDRSIQDLAGVRATSSTEFLPWWLIKLSGGYSEDKQRSEGGFPSVFQTRQEQATFLNELRTGDGGRLILGAETVRQRVSPRNDSSGAVQFDRDRRDTNSAFASVVQSQGGQRLEANARYDRDDQFGSRTTGSVSMGSLVTNDVSLAATYAQGFRAPTFNDLYLVSFLAFYQPNPDLRPERSRTSEITLKSAYAGGLQWRLTGYDNRVTDLITLTSDENFVSHVTNVARARVRGIEAAADITWYGVHVRGQLTAQRPRDDDTGKRLPQRAERYGTLEASRSWGSITVGANVIASGSRFDSAGESPAARMGGYARVDARVRWAATKHVAVELTAVNVGDKRYENALGYDAPRRGAFLNVRFDAF